MRFRLALALAFSVVVAYALDLWLRVAILRRFRDDEARRIAGIRRLTKTWGRLVFGVARVALRLRVRVEGLPIPPGRYLVVSNHQSSLDIPLLIATLEALDLAFVAMEPLRHGHPLISTVLRHGGSAFVKKESLAEDLVEIARFGREVDRLGSSALIFPEGGLARDGVLRPFRLAGLEAVRSATRLPILPVVVDGLWHAPTAKEYARLAGALVTVRVGPPSPPEAVDADPRAAYAALEASMRESLAAIRRGRSDA